MNNLVKKPLSAAWGTTERFASRPHVELGGSSDCLGQRDQQKNEKTHKNLASKRGFLLSIVRIVAS